MSKRFFVCTEKQSILFDRSVIGYAKGKKLAWWHQMGTVWLFADNSGRLTANQLRNDLGEFDSQPLSVGNFLVIEMPDFGGSWGMHYEDPVKMDWLSKAWARPSLPHIARAVQNPSIRGKLEAEAARLLEGEALEGMRKAFGIGNPPPT